MSQIAFELNVLDEVVPITSMDIVGSSVGSTGHLTAVCGMGALEDAGIDLVALSIANPGSLEVNAFVTIDGFRTQVFGGEYVTGNYQYNRQAVTIHARDWAGPLIDQKRVLVNILKGDGGALAPAEKSTKGISTQNQKLSQIVSAIAEQFSMVPDVRLGSGPNDDPNVGTIFGNANDTVLTSTPQSLWAVLTRLARDSGNVVYCTPQRHLVFGPPGAGLLPIPLFYRVNPIPPGGYGALDLNIDHNPRRNLTFRVVVLSYDHTNSTMTKGQAYVVGSNYSTDSNSTVHAGAWSGADAEKITKATGGGKKSAKNAIPVYTFHVDGLTQAQAQQQATAIATDISKRELVAHVESRCIPGVQPANMATIMGLINAEFQTHTYFVTQYTHRFAMPRGEGSEAVFSTQLTLLDHQPTGKGDSVSGGDKST